MSIFISDDDNDVVSKLNIDSLYEKRQKRDLKQLSIFNKILNRIHKRIDYTSKNKNCNDTHIWFLVPQYLVGEPVYDKGECIGYLVSQLEQNGFFVKYVHPQTLFVSWHNWIPSYVRNEIKKKTGVNVDERGNVISYEEEEQNKKSISGEKEGKTYSSVKDYKPSGNLLYSQDILDKLEKRLK
tara:strand:+ start:150 stop:698 length:549 start_codon:yes stop_codon:yes gene_type:complete